jgi:hypothetical protein
VKKQFALLVVGLVAVLLVAGQLARATAGPGPTLALPHHGVLQSDRLPAAPQRNVR